jgi:hypothetical protein
VNGAIQFVEHSAIHSDQDHRARDCNAASAASRFDLMGPWFAADSLLRFLVDRFALSRVEVHSFRLGSRHSLFRIRLELSFYPIEQPASRSGRD